jgi:recombination protein RecT
METKNLPAVSKAASIRGLLEKSKKQMALALPKHLSADRLLRVAMTSIQKNPKLLDCTQQSLLACVMTCAQLGLEPDQFLGQAYLVPFKDTKKGIVVCTLIPGYRGYIALARRSGEVKSVSAQVVYENDDFVLQYGIDEKLTHTPAEGDRGEAKGAYVIFKYKDGGYSFDYMSKSDIEKIRKRSKSANDGPWVTDWDEMAKKTVIKRHSKVTPLSVELQTAIALEDRANNQEAQDDLLGIDDGNVIDAETGNEEQQSDEQKTAALKTFDENIPSDVDKDILAEFLTRTAESNKTTVDEVKIEAAKDNENFLKILYAYQKAALKKKPAKKADAEDDVTATIECPNSPGDFYKKGHCKKCESFAGCPAWT